MRRKTSGMAMPRPFRSLNVIPGPWFPEWNLYLGCSIEVRDGEGAIVDPGSDRAALAEVAARGVRININSHCHGDHILYNSLFPGAGLWASAGEAGLYGSIDKASVEFGLPPALAEDWRVNINPWERSALAMAVSRKLGDGERVVVGDTEMVFRLTPGHTSGMLCIEFPGERAVYTADVDLTRFGPWYGQLSSDIDAFVASARALAEIDADWFITAHEEGLLTAEEFRRRLPDYLAVVDRREHKLLSRLGEPRAVGELVRGGIVYPPRALASAWTVHWETMHVLAHLRRLSGLGAVERLEDGRYRSVVWSA